MNLGAEDMLLAAEINARSVMAFAVIQGMVAENQRRESEGMSQAYSDLTFFEVRDDLEQVLKKANL